MKEIDKTGERFADYFHTWFKREKEGTVKDITLKKYIMTGQWLRVIAPNIKIKDLDRFEYQKIINKYGETHEYQTTMDFHTHLKACTTSMFEDKIIDRNPALRAKITGMTPKKKPEKFMGLSELNRLIETLELSQNLNKDWVILILSKTGLRFAECMGLTPDDFDFDRRKMTINKTWDYKSNSGFAPTKNKSSMRTIDIDWQITAQLKPLIENLQRDEPIFIEKNENGSYKKIYNSTYNCFLKKKCKEAGVPIISLHGLRHTHGSILISQGVSTLSVSKRLGHSTVTTTEQIYLHITDELAKKDNTLMMGALAGIV